MYKHINICCGISTSLLPHVYTHIYTTHNPLLNWHLPISFVQGEDVFQALLEAGRDRRVTLKIAQNVPSQVSPNTDTEFLSKKANAQVRSLNFPALIGGGILHTKLWIIDRKHVYIGSANMDWRALTQVKELGFVAMNCSCLAEDIAKVFDVRETPHIFF